MTKQETIQILQLLTANYTDFERKMTDKANATIIINLWAQMFKDADEKEVQVAVFQYINSNKFPPTISDIQDYIFKNKTQIKELTDYWNEAYNMICKGLYMTQEQFDSASPEVRRFFGNVRQVKELAMCDTDLVNTVIKGQFLKQIEIIIKREKEKKMLPSGMKKYIELLAEKKDMTKLLEGSN